MVVPGCDPFPPTPRIGPRTGSRVLPGCLIPSLVGPKRDTASRFCRASPSSTPSLTSLPGTSEQGCKCHMNSPGERAPPATVVSPALQQHGHPSVKLCFHNFPLRVHTAGPFSHADLKAVCHTASSHPQVWSGIWKSRCHLTEHEALRVSHVTGSPPHQSSPFSLTVLCSRSDVISFCIRICLPGAPLRAGFGRRDGGPIDLALSWRVKIWILDQKQRWLLNDSRGYIFRCPCCTKSATHGPAQLCLLVPAVSCHH